jgi:cytochrome oxidase assembly protein ShyY1
VQSIGEEVSAANTGQTVRLTGRFDPSRQVIVPNRLNNGQSGVWVVTAFDFRVSSASTGPTRIPVVRGWLPSGQSPVAPPRGDIELVGRLEPSEPDTMRDPALSQLPPGQVAIISSPELLSLWRPPLFLGYVIADKPKPVPPMQLVSAPPANAENDINWRNLAYALQWWVFAGFAVFWFIRIYREEQDAGARQQPHDEIAAMGKKSPKENDVGQQ